MSQPVPFQCDFVVIDGRKFYAPDHLVEFARQMPEFVSLKALESIFQQVEMQYQPTAGNA